jgi:aspartate carbamoyltransferase regulatory subunit
MKKYDSRVRTINHCVELAVKCPNPECPSHRTNYGVVYPPVSAKQCYVAKNDTTLSFRCIYCGTKIKITVKRGTEFGE